MGKHIQTSPMVSITQAAAKADAWNRAGRTLWQGIGIDACVAIGLGIGGLLETGDVSSSLFWGALGLLVVKSFLTSAASYFTRLKVVPQTVVRSQ